MDGARSHICKQGSETAADQSRNEEDPHGPHHVPNGEVGPNHEELAHVQSRALSHEQTTPNGDSLPRLEER